MSLWPPWSSSPDDYTVSNQESKKVFKATYNNKATGTQDPVVIRLVSLDLRKVTREHVLDSVKALTSFKHPGTANVLHTFLVGDVLWVIQDPSTPGESQRLPIVIEKSFGEKGLADERVLRAILRQLLEILATLHQRQIFWGDVRGHNLFLRKDGGIEANLLSLRSVAHLKTRDSLPFFSPETLKNTNMTDVKSDIWGFGITALQLFNGSSPFKDVTSIHKLLEIFAEGTSPMESLQGEEVSKALRSMLESCFRVDPAERPTAQELLDHPFFKGDWDIRKDKEVIRRALEYPESEVPLTKPRGRSFSDQPLHMSQFVGTESAPLNTTTSEIQRKHSAASSSSLEAGVLQKKAIQATKAEKEGKGRKAQEEQDRPALGEVDREGNENKTQTPDDQVFERSNSDQRRKINPERSTNQSRESSQSREEPTRQQKDLRQAMSQESISKARPGTVGIAKSLKKSGTKHKRPPIAEQKRVEPERPRNQAVMRERDEKQLAPHQEQRMSAKEEAPGIVRTPRNKPEEAQRGDTRLDESGNIAPHLRESRSDAQSTPPARAPYGEVETPEQTSFYEPRGFDRTPYHLQEREYYGFGSPHASTREPSGFRTSPGIPWERDYGRSHRGETPRDALLHGETGRSSTSVIQDGGRPGLQADEPHGRPHGAPYGPPRSEGYPNPSREPMYDRRREFGPPREVLPRDEMYFARYPYWRYYGPHFEDEEFERRQMTLRGRSTMWPSPPPLPRGAPWAVGPWPEHGREYREYGSMRARERDLYGVPYDGRRYPQGGYASYGPSSYGMYGQDYVYGRGYEDRGYGGFSRYPYEPLGYGIYRDRYEREMWELEQRERERWEREKEWEMRHRYQRGFYEGEEAYCGGPREGEGRYAGPNDRIPSATDRYGVDPEQYGRYRSDVDPRAARIGYETDVDNVRYESDQDEDPMQDRNEEQPEVETEQKERQGAIKKSGEIGKRSSGQVKYKERNDKPKKQSAEHSKDLSSSNEKSLEKARVGSKRHSYDETVESDESIPRGRKYSNASEKSDDRLFHGRKYAEGHRGNRQVSRKHSGEMEYENPRKNSYSHDESFEHPKRNYPREEENRGSYQNSPREPYSDRNNAWLRRSDYGENEKYAKYGGKEDYYEGRRDSYDESAEDDYVHRKYNKRDEEYNRNYYNKYDTVNYHDDRRCPSNYTRDREDEEEREESQSTSEENWSRYNRRDKQRSSEGEEKTEEEYREQDHWKAINNESYDDDAQHGCGDTAEESEEEAYQNPAGSESRSEPEPSPRGNTSQQKEEEHSKRADEKQQEPIKSERVREVKPEERNGKKVPNNFPNEPILGPDDLKKDEEKLVNISIVPKEPEVDNKVSLEIQAPSAELPIPSVTIPEEFIEDISVTHQGIKGIPSGPPQSLHVPFQTIFGESPQHFLVLVRTIPGSRVDCSLEDEPMTIEAAEALVTETATNLSNTNGNATRFQLVLNVSLPSVLHSYFTTLGRSETSLSFQHGVRPNYKKIIKFPGQVENCVEQQFNEKASAVLIRVKKAHPPE